MIPVKIDVETILAQLSTAGWTDYRIEKACGLPRGWLFKVRKGQIKDPGYSRGARLYNFWAYRFESTPPVAKVVSRKYVDGRLESASWADVLMIGDASNTT